MSRNEEEEAHITLPSAAIIPLRNTLVNAVNKQRAEWLELATKVYNNLKAPEAAADRKALGLLLKNKDAAGYSNLDDFLEKKIKQAQDAETGAWMRNSWDNDDDHYDNDRQWAIERLLISQKKGEPKKIQAPKKKDMAPLLASKTWSFSDNNCSIRIDPEARKLHWVVHRNNYAVERAWEGLLGRTLGKALKEIKWTRGTGGVFNYTDEYSEEAGLEQGYNPISITGTYGPLGETEEENRTGIPRSMRRKIKR